MPRNVTLLELLQDYRAEIRASGNAAHNSSARESQVRLLQRVQQGLWEDHDWPHLRVERTQDLQAGQRYYDPPDDVSIDRVEMIEVRYGEEWCPLGYGLDSRHYSTYDSDLDERSWPVTRWQIYEDDQFEVWPVPSDDANVTSLEGRLKITGIRNLNPLVADDDRCDLDSDLIVLHAAAETLGAQGAKDAPLKLQKAQRRELRLTGNLSKVKRFRIFGQPKGPQWKPKGPPRVHYRTS